jgi:hypothetical protein
MAGCSPRYEARVYDAPKTESEFVGTPPAMAAAPRQAPPMMGASTIPLTERRILGAVIPYENVAYFLKATDKIERLALAESDFRTVVERFAIDPEKREMNFELPENWTSKWREDGGQFNVIAEFNVKAGSGTPIKFTVTELSKPADLASWDSYLLVNINRWRGQLQLPETDLIALQNQLPSIKRDGFALPAYIFDANGAGSAASPPAASPPAAASPSPPTSESPLKLAYDKPDTWEIQPAKPFRLATFKIANSERPGEVVVSLAKDSPVPNAEMWFEQVLQSEDKEIIRPLATKSVNDAEEIQAGTRSGKLYSIRSGDEASSPVLLVAAIPTGENEICLFVKLKADLRTSEEQKSNLLSFVNSLRWE